MSKWDICKKSRLFVHYYFKYHRFYRHSRINWLPPQGVYKTPYPWRAVSMCDTGRLIKTLLLNINAVKDFSKSAVIMHWHNPGHQILFDNILILVRSTYFVNRKIRKPIEILKYPRNINWETGYPFPSVWNTLVQIRCSDTAPIPRLTVSNAI